MPLHAVICLEKSVSPSLVLRVQEAWRWTGYKSNPPFELPQSGVLDAQTLLCRYRNRITLTCAAPLPLLSYRIMNNNDSLASVYAKHLSPNANAAMAWTSFASEFLEHAEPVAGGFAVVRIDELTLSGHSEKISNLRLRLGDLLSCSARTGASLLGLGFSTLDPSLALPLAVTHVLLFIRDVKELRTVTLTEDDVKLLLWMEEYPRTWVDQEECVAQFGNVIPSLRRLEALGCLASDNTDKEKWRIVEQVHLAPEVIRNDG